MLRYRPQPLILVTLLWCVRGRGVIRVAVNRKADESVAARIIRMVEESGERKSHTENFITTFARYYTPVVVILALLLSAVPPFVFGESFSEWLKRALIFLVVSCPCALVISIPLSYFGGIGQLARHGVMFKGSNFLDAFSRVSTMFLDKTGTLTTGKFSLKRITSAVPADDRGLFVKAASLEQYSSHPLAVSLMEAAARDSIHLLPVKDIRESAGRGLSGNVAGSEIIVGNYQMMLDCAVKGLPENVQVPAGFVAATYDTGRIKLKGYVDKNSNFICFMTDENGVGDFYLYNPETGSFQIYRPADRRPEILYKYMFEVFLIIAIIEAVSLIITVYMVRRIIADKANPRPKRV